MANLLNVSVPTKVQIIHGLERVGLIFITVFMGLWLKTADPFSTAAVTSAAFAAGTAVWELVKSSLTNL